MINVLFVAKKIPKFNHVSPFTLDQANSLRSQGIGLDIYMSKGAGLFSYLRNIIDLHKYLKVRNYDIIHSHYGLQGLVSFIASPYQNHIVSFMGSDINSLNAKKKYTIASILIHFYISKLKRIKGVIVKSKAMLNILDIEHPNITVIPNGVDFDKFYPKDKKECRSILGYNKDDKIIGFFSAYHPNKNKNLKLAQEAKEKIVDYNCKLILINGIKHSNLVDYYNSIDILLLTSLSEGSPNVIKEAMACNCPIVSTDAGDVKKVIGNTKGCYICSYDPQDVSNKIKLAFNFRKKTNGRERINQLGLDSVTIAKKIQHIYAEVTGK